MGCEISQVYCLVSLHPRAAQACHHWDYKFLVCRLLCSSCAAASRQAMLLDFRDLKILLIIEICCVAWMRYLLVSWSLLPDQNVSVDFLYHCQNKC